MLSRQCHSDMNLLLHNIPLTFSFLAKIEDYGSLSESHPLTREMRGAAHTALLARSALPGLLAACVQRLGPMLHTPVPPGDFGNVIPKQTHRDTLISPSPPKLD